jgi:putative ABC transport system substrate-binding protein
MAVAAGTKVSVHTGDTTMSESDALFGLLSVRQTSGAETGESPIFGIRRREFITLIGGAAVWPLAARAQQVSTRRPLVAVLSAITRERNSPLKAFLQGMREFGYVEGQNIDIEYRFAEGRLERFPALAEELVRLSPNVIVALVTPAAVATRAITQTIPIVCPLLADPIHFGLIARDSRPGGNVTGVLFRTEGLAGKQLELALQMIPDVVTIGFVVNVASGVIIDRIGASVSEVRH